VLSVFSGYYLNKLSNKTSAILNENFRSVVYAREISEGIMAINYEITTGFLTNKKPDSERISKELKLIDKSLLAEKNNITEPGENELVLSIETGYSAFRDSVMNIIQGSETGSGVVGLQNESAGLYQKLLILSQMNSKALEVKTDDAKTASKNALTKMTILATLCFLIGMSFTYSFASYFNQRFFQLYNGIKDLVSSNFDQRLFLDGNDEFHEISLVLNEMAADLKKSKQKMSVTLQGDVRKEINATEVEELKEMLSRIKNMEEQAAALISKIEKK
jgi:methyl-accepting chemotaxis protein